MASAVSRVLIEMIRPNPSARVWHIRFHVGADRQVAFDRQRVGASALISAAVS